MVKVVPVLGTLVLLGAIVEVFLGFQVANDIGSLRIPHIFMGLVGLVLVAVLAGISFRSKISTRYSRLVVAILTILVLLQIFLGFQVLGGTDSMTNSHEVNGVLILVLALVLGGITSTTARRQHIRPA